ncbi:MAG TPA: hypothetical protein VMS31_03855 [Pyrinomonadaceae bacterium]|nr:hypothetical protein [Pyrinomonadaceae bacterium]
MSRLDYAPKLKDIKITDIKKGIGVFTPKPEKPVSFDALKETLKKAGYALDAGRIRVTGTLTKQPAAALLIVTASGQRFVLEGANLEQLLSSLASGGVVEVVGDWKTVGSGADAREVITVEFAKAVGDAPRKVAGHRNLALPGALSFVNARFDDAGTKGSPAFSKPAAAAAEAVAPIRVTSPGLTVFKGGAITPRAYFIHQHLGSLQVDRQVFDLAVSYTPSPRVQLEVEVPVSRTSYQDNSTSGAGRGGSSAALGNITLWSKYRFFREVKTYGDRQAALRFGLELPTGKKDAPTQTRINVPAFVRQQLTPISGGLSPHFDVAFSQAGGRFIFGGNVEGILRGERDGFRLGHEVRVSTDTEYVLFPRQYDVPGGEVFVILETTFIHRGEGRLNSAEVSGSSSTEYYLAPGLQYAAAPQFVIEGSFQFPVIRNTGPLVLRTDRNLLLGVRYLF